MCRDAVGIGLPSASSAGQSIPSIEIKASKGPSAFAKPCYDIVLWAERREARGLELLLVQALSSIHFINSFSHFCSGHSSPAFSKNIATSFQTKSIFSAHHAIAVTTHYPAVIHTSITWVTLSSCIKLIVSKTLEHSTIGIESNWCKASWALKSLSTQNLFIVCVNRWPIPSCSLFRAANWRISTMRASDRPSVFVAYFPIYRISASSVTIGEVSMLAHHKANRMGM